VTSVGARGVITVMKKSLVFFVGGGCRFVTFCLWIIKYLDDVSSGVLMAGVGGTFPPQSVCFSKNISKQASLSWKWGVLSSWQPFFRDVLWKDRGSMLIS